MDDVLARAADLGKAVRATEKFRALRAAEAAVMKSPGTVTLAEALVTLQKERADLDRAGKPLDDAFKVRFEKVAAAAAIDPGLIALSKAQKEFQALIDEVSRAMLAELKP
jgi:cell fate (sporulation/competence/biofilm development) regulator YlbF (YheA/YmcA/DUF963 family)